MKCSSRHSARHHGSQSSGAPHEAPPDEGAQQQRRTSTSPQPKVTTTRPAAQQHWGRSPSPGPGAPSRPSAQQKKRQRSSSAEPQHLARRPWHHMRHRSSSPAHRPSNGRSLQHHRHLSTSPKADIAPRPPTERLRASSAAQKIPARDLEHQKRDKSCSPKLRSSKNSFPQQRPSIAGQQAAATRSHSPKPSKKRSLQQARGKSSSPELRRSSAWQHKHRGSSPMSRFASEPSDHKASACPDAKFKQQPSSFGLVGAVHSSNSSKAAPGNVASLHDNQPPSALTSREQHSEANTKHKERNLSKHADDASPCNCSPTGVQASTGLGHTAQAVHASGVQ